MIYQLWANNPQWENEDPKLSQLKTLPFIMPHTKNLVNKISLYPGGILMVRGPRQAGKSTLLRQLVQKAISEHIPPENIALIEAESLESRHDLLGEINQFRGSHKGHDIILIDEITSIEKWWATLKVAVDDGTLSQSLVICTGSSALDLSEGLDLLPGRRGKRYPVNFELLPARFADVADHVSLDDFLLTGGFPWAINEFIRHRSIPPYVYDVYSSWIIGTLLRKKHPPYTLSPMLRAIAERTTSGISVIKLARDCGIGSNHTAETYLSILEHNYVLMVSHWSEPGSNVEAPRKNRKFYPVDPFLFHLFHNFGQSFDNAFLLSCERRNNPRHAGALVECLVASELRHRSEMFPLRYFLGSKEIDFIGKEAIEVKFQNHVDLDEFKWVEKSIPKNMSFTVITKNTTSTMGRFRALTLKDWLLLPTANS